MTHVSPPSVGCGSKGWSCHRMQPRRYAFDFGLVSAVSMRADRLLLFFFDFSFFYFIFLSVLRPLLRCMVRRWLRIGSRRAALLLLRSQHFFNSRAVGDGAQDSSCCCCFYKTEDRRRTTKIKIKTMNDKMRTRKQALWIGIGTV